MDFTPDYSQISDYIKSNDVKVISVNFVSTFEQAYSFFANQKRYKRMEDKRISGKVLVSSNVKPDSEEDVVVNYHSLIDRKYKYFENSTVM